jgi:hypothetical protein
MFNVVKKEPKDELNEMNNNVKQKYNYYIIIIIKQLYS